MVGGSESQSPSSDERTERTIAKTLTVAQCMRSTIPVILTMLEIFIQFKE